MRKIHSDEKHDFYFSSACGSNPALYNIVPKGADNPNAGYENMTIPEKRYKTRFPCRYQPEVNGMRRLFNKWGKKK